MTQEQGENSLEREIVIQSLKDYALSVIEHQYGTGDNDGLRPKRYHNRLHTQGVIEDVEMLATEAAKKGKIEVIEVSQLGLTASFHDIDQDLERVAREIASADELRQKMKESKVFSDEEIERAVERIIGTTVWWDEKGVMHQAVDTDDYGAMLLGDADLANLGRPTEVYLKTSERYMKEIFGDNPPIEDQIKFWKSNITLLETHEFFTEEARRLFPNQRQNLEATRDKLAGLK